MQHTLLFLFFWQFYKSNMNCSKQVESLFTCKIFFAQKNYPKIKLNSFSVKWELVTLLTVSDIASHKLYQSATKIPLLQDTKLLMKEVYDVVGFICLV